MNMLIEVDGLLRVPENKYYDDNVVTSYKGRTIDTSEPIIVYRNLTRKGKVYSIKQGGLVVAHATAICVRDVEFIVNIKGKIRVMKSKKREDGVLTKHAEELINLSVRKTHP